MTWEELAEANQEAARFLMGSAELLHHRAVCGRAYYAAYSLVTAKLPTNTRFGRGWNNPGHAKLPECVNLIGNLGTEEHRRIKIAIRRPRHRREDAEYRSKATVSFLDAKEALRDVEEIRRLLR
jgi:uncharacterized protein (UPF0332 family)